MSFKLSFASLFLVSLSTIPATLSQEITPPRATSSPRINLDVVVTPKSGGPVAGLQQQDFAVMVNKTSQPIVAFKAVAGAQEPVEVVLLIDAVNTSYPTIGYERGQIANFLLANGGRLAYPTTLAVMTDTGTQIQQSFTNDGKAINDSFEHYAVGLRDIRRSAGFYGAAERYQISVKSLEMLVAQEATHPGRKIILWLSPGWPLLSGPGVRIDPKEEQQLFRTIVGFSAEMRQARITLYSINPNGVDEGPGRTFYYEEFVKGVAKPSQTQPGNLSAQVLATQSGGLVLSSTDIASSLKQSVADLDAYYEISFDPLPAEQPNEYHSIEVKVDKPGLAARTRTGYYSQP